MRPADPHVKLLILARERLVADALASLLRPRYETYAIRSIEMAAAVLRDERLDAGIWFGERLDGDAMRQLRHLRSIHHGVRLLVLARVADPRALAELAAVEHEGLCVLCRHDERLDVPQLIESVDAMLAGRVRSSAAALERMTDDPRAPDVVTSLTPREQEVLSLIAFGLRNREIARWTSRSEKAVEKRVSAVLHKLELGPDTAGDLDRRVVAARIFFGCRPGSAGRGLPAEPCQSGDSAAVLRR